MRPGRWSEAACSINPDHWLVRTAQGNELRWSGRIEESIELFRREAQRDPLNLVLRENLVAFLVWAGRFEDARAELERTFELVHSKSELGSTRTAIILPTVGCEILIISDA